MQTHPFAPPVAEETIERAFAIAVDYIALTGVVADAAVAEEFIACTLARLLQAGERHPIRLANLAIAAWEQAYDHTAGMRAAQ